MNAVYFIAGVLVSFVIFMIYDYFVSKETTKIFNELENELEEWKTAALEDDKDD